MTTEQAEAVWQILVEECGATFDHGFVFHETTKYIDEWRFMGRLGFGGKFRRNRGWRDDGTWGEKWYVDCYPEDETDDRRALIAAANKRLADLQGVSA